MTSDERSRLPFEKIVDEVKRLKRDGNDNYWKDKNYSFAIKKWRKAVIMIEEYPVGNEKDEQVRRELVWMMLYASVAQGYLRLERPVEACIACNLGLKWADIHEESSLELYFRFAKAKLMLKDHKAGLGLINGGALNIEPFNRHCLQLKLERKEEWVAFKKMLVVACLVIIGTRSPKKSDKGGFTKSKGFTDLMNKVQESSEKMKKLTLEKSVRKLDWDSELNVRDRPSCSEAQLEMLNSELLKGPNTNSI
ncbi:unnamed protein product [Orchesella dallaii]|uniref:Uncharacterized protein n=1 Tax=Orchesella dallaii TaxID=48710 RepID=A0ABP1PXQ7_9HEXA